MKTISAALLLFWLYTPLSSPQLMSTTDCDVPPGDPTLALPITDTTLLDYLNQGGDPDELETLLVDTNRIGQRIKADGDTMFPVWARNRGGVYTEDIDQNGFADVIIALSFTEIGGGIFILGCEIDRYEKLAEFTEQDYCSEDCLFDLYTPKMIFVGDMNVDGFPEIVYEMAYSGMTTGWMDIRIESWDTEAQDLLPINHSSIEYPFGGCFDPDVDRALLEGSSEVKDVDGDGILDLVVQTGCSGSGFAAGPQRSHQLVFGWDGNQYVETAYQPDPPRYRLHAAYDALYALNQNDAAFALSLYEAALTDEHLEEWDNHNIRWIVTSHALYGKLLSTVAIHDPSSTEAEQSFTEIIQSADDLELSDTLWVSMAVVFWSEISTGENASSACEAVNDELRITLAEAPPFLYGLNEIGYWPQFGYEVNWVPSERGLSMCPL